MWVVLIVVIILIYYLFTFNRKRRAKTVYTCIDHDNDLKTARKFIQLTDPHTALEYYRIANIYDFVLKDSGVAKKYYISAIDRARDDQENVDFIMDRMRDRIDIHDTAEIDDNKFDVLDLLDMENELIELERIIENSLNDNHRDNSREPESKIKFVSDSQNVHDSNINNEMATQYAKIISNNSVIQYETNIDTIREYFDGPYRQKCRHDNDKKNIQDAIKMLDIIETRNPHIMKLNTRECDLVINVFNYILYTADVSNQSKQTAVENLVMNLKECYSNGTPVCITGRATRILSSLAYIDSSGLGILRSNQVIKNELFSKAGSVRDRIINEANENVKKDYNNGKDTFETQVLDSRIQKEIKDMAHKDYSIYGSKFIEGCLNEIGAV